MFSLTSYINDIKKFEPLSREEEIQWFKKLHNGDKTARDKIATANLRFVFQVAKDYQGRGLDFEDLVAEGNIGLLKAIDKFELDREVKFISYAVFWIRQSILNALYKNVLAIKLPLSKMVNITKLTTLKARLESELSRAPTDQEIEDALEDPSLLEDLKYVFNYLSLDYPSGDSENSTLHEVITHEDWIDEIPSFESFEDEFKTAVAKLSEREQRILAMYYGIGYIRTHTLREIGIEFGLTRERIRQIKAASLERLKKQKLSKRLLDFL